jgi:SAM-dependent methyltransferase
MIRRIIFLIKIRYYTMTLQQAIDLISPAGTLLRSDQVPTTGHVPGLPVEQTPRTQKWADLGCGSGIFTTALAHLLPAGSIVYGVDTHPTVRQQSIAIDWQQPGPGNPARPTSIMPITADFVKDPLDLPLLDGILMANSLHYVKDKRALIQNLRSYMHPHAPFLIVEYDMDKPVATWVPYPISYDELTRLFSGHPIQKLGQRPSTFGRANLYGALIRN